MTETGKYKPATLMAQGLGWVDGGTGAVTTPVHPSTTFEHGSDFTYQRYGGPGHAQPEALLAALEGGAAARLFASGMAAATAVFLALEPGDHVIAPEVMYWALRKWLVESPERRGLEVSLVPNGDMDALRAALRPGKTRMVWVETPANPLWSITDIAETAAAAHEAGALLGIDSTVQTPVLTRPLELGADIVMHSASKYLNGHSDVLGGALITARDDDFWARVDMVRRENGAVLGAFEAWLLLRGLRTLALRVRAASANALAIAEHFHGHPKVAQVLYPGLPTHPGHEIAGRQMTGGFGGMLSLRVAGGEDAAIQVAAGTTLFKQATSLGGVESLIEHRAGSEGPSSPTPRDLLRLSVGIEDAGDLVSDLEAALEN